MNWRATGATMSVVMGAAVGALVSQDSRLIGAVIGAVGGIVAALGLAISLRPSRSERAFMAQHGWVRGQVPDFVANYALVDRPYVGRGRHVIEGPWRGRRAARFVVNLSEGVNSKDVWIEGVFVDGYMPKVDLVAKGNRRRRYGDQLSAFARAWHVHATDIEFAEALIHDQMRARLLSAPLPRRAVYFGGGFIGVRYEESGPSLDETPARLDFVSDLADLIPRAAWDVLLTRMAPGEEVDSKPVDDHEYARAHVGSLATEPLVLSATSEDAKSLRRVILTVLVVVVLAVTALYVIT